MEQTATLAKPELKPSIVEDVTLISPGVWTGTDNHPTNYSPETILKGFENSDWKNMNLFLDHQDTKARGVSNWAGFIRNPKMVGSELHGDLEVWHPMISMFIEEAKAKFGVSMTTEGIEKMLSNDLYDYDINRFVSFSIVDDPACKISWINKALSAGCDTKTIISGSVEMNSKKELAQVTNMEEIRKQKGMSVSEFYAVLKDPPSASKLPIFDAVHVRNALARFNQTHFDNASQKKTAWNKIIHAANKFGIKVSKENSGNIEPKREVEKMSDNIEDQKTVEVKEEEEVKEEAVESKEESEDVKVLGAKVDKLSSDMGELTAIVKKSLSAEEESKESEEKPEEESKEEPSEESKEESESEKELAEVKKELAALKEKDNIPDRKSLASSGNSSPNVDVNSANIGMLGFLREKANLNY